jgi:hypothetical protein
MRVFLLLSVSLFVSCLIKKTVSIVDLPDMKPIWFLFISLKLCSMALSHSFIGGLISLVPNNYYNFKHPWFLKIGTKVLRLHSSDIPFNRKMRLNKLVSKTIAMFLKLLHTLMGIPFWPIGLPPIILKDIFTLKFLNTSHFHNEMSKEMSSSNNGII